MHIFLSSEHAGLLKPFTLLRERFFPKNRVSRKLAPAGKQLQAV